MAKQQQRRRLDSNTLISITATIVSISALFLSVYQTILSRQQQSASVWPKLIIGNGYMKNLGNDSFYRLYVRNVGIGPAVIKNVTIRHKNQSFNTMTEYGRTVLQTHQALDSLAFDEQDLTDEDVIPQGETVFLFDTYKNRFANLFINNLADFELTVSYESIYGEKWTVYYPAWRKPKK